MSKTYLLVKLFLLLTVFIFPFASKSQINLVKDINGFTNGSDPNGFINITLNGTIYFIANDGPHGQELWKTDGTGTTTNIVKDINPGLGSGILNGQWLLVFNGAIYFVANNGTETGLWKTDGTEAGTIQLTVTNIYSQLAVLNGMLYFSSSDAANGIELWKTDGTVSGTVIVKDIYPGNAGSQPSNLYVYNGSLYFVATNGINGRELWKADGSAAGTVLLKDIFSGTAGSQPSGFYEYNGNLYFTANDAINGIELWRTDGTVAGTTLVKDIIPGLQSANPQYFFQFNGNMFFYITSSTFGKELWKTDGSSGGTVFVQTIDFGPSFVVPTILNGAFYFSAFDNTHGTELWKSDGTTAGTFMLKDIESDVNNPNNDGNGSSYPYNLTLLNGAIYFSAKDSANGSELWKTDGTAAGTVIVKDIYPGAYMDFDLPVPLMVPYSSMATSLINYNGLIYFIANDGIHGNELWKTDGTTAGTGLVQDIVPGLPGALPYTFYSGSNLKVINGLLYFQANNGFDGIEPWKSDGTATGASMVKNIHIFTGGSSPANLTAVNEKVYFNANYGLTGNELWVSDGSDAGTYLVKDINPGAASSSLRYFTKFNDKLIFSADDGVHNSEIWISDGTEPGTFMLKDILPGSASSVSANFSAIGNTLYFTASDGVNGAELWKTDGTTTGTVMVKNIRPGSASSIGFGSGIVVNSGGINYFTANDGINGAELWKTDGTTAGTVMVKDIKAGSNGSVPTLLTDVNGTLFFKANSDIDGDELWKSDGTNAGTVLVKDTYPGNFNSNIFSLCNVNGILYYTASDIGHPDILLWKSDGTTAGTVIQTSNGNLCKVPSQQLTPLFNVNGILFYMGQDGIHGAELWKSDGTDAGTFMVKDINTELDYSSNPSDFIEINGLAYFAAYDSAHGRELWRSDGTNAGTVLVQDKYPGINHFYYGPMAKTSSKLFINGTHFTTGGELYAMCTTSVGPATSNASVTKFIEEGTEFTFTACQAIARVNPSGASPVTGLTTSKVWIEPAVQTVGPDPFVARHYEITPDYNPSNSTGKVTLYFTQEEFNDFNNHPGSALDLPAGPTDVIGKDNLRIGKYPGTSNNATGLPGSYTGAPVIINPADSNIVWNATNNRWEVSFDVTGFSGFIVQTKGTALPVKLVSFNGKINTDKTVTLQWKVEGQSGITNYVVERSNNGTGFLPIGTVTANQLSSYTYQFVDVEKLTGKAFYRLRINEVTGSFRNSDIVFLSIKDNSALTVFPNPAKDVINVQLNSDQPRAMVKIIDEQGRLMLSETILTNQKNKIDITHLASGFYILQTIDGNRVTRASIYKR